LRLPQKSFYREALHIASRLKDDIRHAELRDRIMINPRDTKEYASYAKNLTDGHRSPVTENRQTISGDGDTYRRAYSDDSSGPGIHGITTKQGDYAETPGPSRSRNK
jgi:hypothetical protein